MVFNFFDNFEILINKFFALIILLLIFPLMILLIILVKINLGSPVFFRQSRTGIDGVLFTMVKFRTMLNIKDGYKSDSERITKFGKFLRSTSLDELPELLNVLKGDMNIVGPRPLLGEYLNRYSKEQFRRHEVKPGITGWAQVNGRNAISWEEKFELDVWFIDNKSFFLEIKIIFLTVLKVFRRDGVSSKNHSTMPIFYGKLK